MRVYSPATLLLTAVVAMSFLGLGFVMPLRSLYASDMGASGAEVGLMASAFMLSGLLAAPTVGRLSDQVGHARLLWVWLALHSVLVLLYLPVQSPVGLIGLRALEGIAVACAMPPARALMVRLVPPGRQGEGAALISNARAAGILLGPAVGAFLAAWLGYTPSFLLASACLALAALVAGVVLGRHTSSAGTATRAEITPARWTRPLALACGLGLVLALPQGLGAALWAIYMRDRGASLELIGLSFTVFAILPLIVAPLTGRWSDRHGRRLPLLIGLVALALVYSLYAAPIGALAILAVSFVEGAPSSLARSAADGLIADVSPRGGEGRAQARFTAAQNAGSLIGATAGGVLYELSSGAPFALLAGVYLVSALLLLTPALARLFSRPALAYPVA